MFIQFCNLCLLTGKLNLCIFIVNDTFGLISSISCLMFTIFFLFASWPSIGILKTFLYDPSLFLLLLGATDCTVIVIIFVVTQHFNIYRTEILFYHVDSCLIYLFSF